MKNVWWELGPWRELLKAPPQVQWGVLLPSSNPPVSSSVTHWPNLNGSRWARELGKCNMQRLALQRAEQGKDGEQIWDPRGERPVQTLNLRNISLFIRAAGRHATSPIDEFLFSTESGGHLEDSPENTQAMWTLTPNLSTQSDGLLFGEVFEMQEHWTSEPQIIGVCGRNGQAVCKRSGPQGRNTLFGIQDIRFRSRNLSLSLENENILATRDFTSADTKFFS